VHVEFVSCAAKLAECGSFLHLGCWADTDPDNRDINDLVAQMGSGITVDKCASYCSGSGFPFAGLQLNGACYCGYTYGSQGTSFSALLSLSTGWLKKVSCILW